MMDEYIGFDIEMARKQCRVCKEEYGIADSQIIDYDRLVNVDLLPNRDNSFS